MSFCGNVINEMLPGERAEVPLRKRSIVQVRTAARRTA
jgi:hypothetical protein